MEKIYEENNQSNNDSKFKKVMGSKVPHHFSALLILVAFASFLAIGFRGHESYAIDPEQLPDEFETIPLGNSAYREIMSTKPANLDIAESEGYIEGSNVPYNFTTTDPAIQVFCLDKSKEIQTRGSLFKKSDEGVDSGIAYILSQHDAANKSSLHAYEKTWITQVAIWLYQKDQMYPDDAFLKNIDKVTEITALKVPTAEDPFTHYQGNLYNEFVAPLVAAAKNTTNTKLNITKASDNVTVTSDNKYYKTPVITVTGLVSGSTYSLKLTNAPEGTKVYKSDGTEITDLNTINAADNQFYLLSPLDKVTEKSKSVSVAVTGSQYAAVKYNPYNTNGSIDTSIQPLVILTNDTAEKGLELNYSPSVPDTSMNTAQSIYFIGLVILLCGLGIIYANAKPKVTEE
ncbi:MAG: hypothetical protein IJF92_03515 [Bacilli bacterium]|nr:hypothetical protein [Bacilli bacterium]